MTPTPNTPVIGYARVSTDEQGDTGAGLDAQEHAIRAACEARGWQLTQIIREVASGATTARRPALRDVLDRLEQPDGPTALVVAKLDRLTRSVADGARLFERSKAKGWAIVALDLGVDTTTPAGELVANVMVAVGQWERRTISDRTKVALAQKRRQGVRLGRPPSIDQSKRPAEAKAMKRALKVMRPLRAEGRSYRTIAQALNEQNITGPQGGRYTDMTVRAALLRYGMEDKAA